MYTYRPRVWFELAIADFLGFSHCTRERATFIVLHYTPLRVVDVDLMLGCLIESIC